MEYRGEYLWPPRPETKIPSNMLSFYDNRGYWAQFKKNGTNNVMIVAPDKSYRAWTRHNEPHKAWTARTETLQDIINAAMGYTVFSTELLHSKVPGIQDTIYIFDILAHDGRRLLDETFAQRQELLRSMFSCMDETISHLVVSPNVWLAKNYTTGFEDLFKGITNAEDEGLVLKDPNSVLSFKNSPEANFSWQVKCRKPHKNYSF